MITVHFCCNDRRGNDAGVVRMIEVYVDETHVLSMSSTVWSEDDGDLVGQPCVWRTGALAFVTIAGERLPFVRRRSNVGNVHWEACDMPQLEAEKLVRLLVAKGWKADEWIEEEPWQTIAEGSLA